MIYILIANNGQTYNDYDEWNHGVFKNSVDAIEEGMKTGTCFEVEEWDADKNIRVRSYAYEFHSVYKQWASYKNC